MNFSPSHFTSLVNLLINVGIPVAGMIISVVCFPSLYGIVQYLKLNIHLKPKYLL